MHDILFVSNDIGFLHDTKRFLTKKIEMKGKERCVNEVNLSQYEVVTYNKPTRNSGNVN